MNLRAVRVILLIHFANYGESIINPQRDEPHLIQDQEHPTVVEGETPPPFVPHSVSKPTSPTLIMEQCKCGHHDHNSTRIEQLECGTKPPKERSNVSSLVLPGNITEENQFPWVVALVERRKNNSAVHFCGGTLISSKLVLTATHCFLTKLVANTEVWLNVKTLINNAETLKIKAQRLIVHPGYDPRWNYNDIVLLELSEHVNIAQSNLRPICLPGKDEFVDQEFGYVAGWGQIRFNGPKSTELRHICLPLLTHQQCLDNTYDYYKKRLTEWMICAGDVVHGKRDACPGDSGGPLFVESGPDNRYHLIGIVSWGDQCGLPHGPGVYTRVSKYMTWIYKEMTNITDNAICG